MDSELEVEEVFSNFSVERHSDVYLIFKNIRYGQRYHFYLDNEEEIIASDLRYLGVSRSKCEDLENETCSNDNTVFRFTNVEEENPIIRFKYTSKSEQDFAYVNLKLKTNDYDENAVIIKPENNTIYDVESNSEIVVQVEGGDSGNGTNWEFENKDEIEKAGWIEYLGSSYASNCGYPKIGAPQRSGGCSGTESYKFRIKKVSNSSLIQKIVLVKGIDWNPDYHESLEFSLKVKVPEPECYSKDGYKCCSSDNKTVYYTDTEGEWGIENNDWCIIRKFDKCYRKVGYNCCNKSYIVYTDEEGYWGFENNEWCYV